MAKVFGSVASGVQGVGELISARQEVEVGNFNARISEQRAQAERNSQELLAAQKRKVIKSQVGTQIALFGKRGVKFTGSAIDTITDSLTNANLDIAIDKFNSEVAARGFESDSQIERFQARQRSRVRTARAGSSFLSIAADLTRGRQTLGTEGRPIGVSGPLRKSGRF